MGILLRWGHVQYLAAAFQLVAGSFMIFSPDQLLNGYKPAAGYETLAFEWFGCACICFGISLFIGGSAMKLPNFLYQAMMVVSMGTTFFGKPWRPQSAVSDGSWAMVPATFHALFTVCAFMALNEPTAIKKKGQ